jgi:hypothetical protein
MDPIICEAPVVIFRYGKATEEEFYKEELHNIFVGNQSMVDWATFCDDTHYFIVKHKRLWPKEVTCTCGEPKPQVGLGDL